MRAQRSRLADGRRIASDPAGPPVERRVSTVASARAFGLRLFTQRLVIFMVDGNEDSRPRRGSRPNKHANHIKTMPLAKKPQCPLFVGHASNRPSAMRSPYRLHPPARSQERVPIEHKLLHVAS